MSRLYTVTFEQVAVSAAQDLFEIIGAAGKVASIKRVKISATDTTIPTSQMLALRMRYLPTAVTAGSGGSAPTPQPIDQGDSAAGFTAKANSTTKATTSGTAVTILEDGCHIYNGYDETFDVGQAQGAVKTPPMIGVNESVVFELLSTVTGTVHLSGTCWVEETGA